jgi:hypothetical protein
MSAAGESARVDGGPRGAAAFFNENRAYVIGVVVLLVVVAAFFVARRRGWLPEALTGDGENGDGPDSDGEQEVQRLIAAINS